MSTFLQAMCKGLRETQTSFIGSKPHLEPFLLSLASFKSMPVVPRISRALLASTNASW
jgi:hypothetical protein